MPDSGKLLHLRTPSISPTVRIDAGFIQGDTISSDYDGMIAKLIVSGHTRAVAIRNLYAALKDYEVVGLQTNIEFLKRVCQSPDFVQGDVETGYIQKHHDELFPEPETAPEVFVQAALALLLRETSPANKIAGPHGRTIGFSTTSESQMIFLPSGSNSSSDPVTVAVKSQDQNTFSVSVTGAGLDQSFSNISCKPYSSPNAIMTYFPHTRIHTTLIQDGDELSVFQHGTKTQLKLARPGWFEKALGIKEVTNSVLAPMPCKVLKNEVKEGDEVAKDQALVV